MEKLSPSNLDQDLISNGYNVERVINYRANPIEKYDKDFIEKLKIKMPEIVYVYSQNSAINFLKIIKNYQLETLWMNTNLRCVLVKKPPQFLTKLSGKKFFFLTLEKKNFCYIKFNYGHI